MQKGWRGEWPKMRQAAGAGHFRLRGLIIKSVQEQNL